MIKKLLILSCVLIPFYEVFLYFFVPGRSMPMFPDLRITKEFLAMVFCMVIGSTVLFNYGFSKPKNKWILVFMAFLVWNMYKIPNANFPIQEVNFNGLWNYKPAFQIFAYLYMFLGVSTVNLQKKDVISLFKTFMYCGFAMAVLMILQFFNMDQIFGPLNGVWVKSVHITQIGGSLGQSTTVSPFLVMCLPFALYFKKWLYGVIMCVSVVLAGSSFALAGLCVVIALFFVKKGKSCKWFICGGAIILTIIGVFAYFHPDILDDSYRFSEWKRIFSEVFGEYRFAITGAGIGAFRYFYEMRHQNNWHYAHNEYLQLLWCCGIVGFGIVFMIIKDFIKHSLENINPEITIILISMAGIAAVSFGTFPLQLAVYQFYLVVMLGIVYSLINGGHYGRNL